MIIGIDIREIRPTMAGKGRLTDELVRALLTIDSNNTYYLFGFNKPALAYSSRVRFIQLQGKYGLWLLDLRKKIKKYKVDVFLSPTSYLVVLFSPVPTVMIVSDLAVFIEKHAHPTLKVKVIEKTTFKLAARKARSITAVSEYTKYTITKYFGISPSKITVTPLAVMTKKTLVTGQKIVAERYKLPARFILFVGTLEPRKNIENVIEAYAHLPSALRSVVPLVLVGQRGWNTQGIDEKIKKYHLENTIREIGFVSDGDLPAFYECATVFCYPSWFEGFGLPVLEAMSYGLPTITSNVTSLPEVAGDGALCVDPAKPRAIGDALNRLLTDAKLRDTLRTKGKARVKQFSWEVTARQTLSVLELVVLKASKDIQTEM